MGRDKIPLNDYFLIWSKTMNITDHTCLILFFFSLHQGTQCHQTQLWSVRHTTAGRGMRWTWSGRWRTKREVAWQVSFWSMCGCQSNREGGTAATLLGRGERRGSAHQFGTAASFRTRKPGVTPLVDWHQRLPTSFGSRLSTTALSDTHRKQKLQVQQVERLFEWKKCGEAKFQEKSAQIMVQLVIYDQNC